MYFVVDPSGAQYGPADGALLAQWAREGRVMPSTTLRNADTGETIAASALPGLFPSMAAAPYSPPPPGPTPYYAAYPRGPVYDPMARQESSKAWALAICSLVGAPASCVCCILLGGAGAICGILGIVISNRGNRAGSDLRGPLIMSWIGLILSILAVAMQILFMAIAFNSGFGPGF